MSGRDGDAPGGHDRGAPRAVLALAIAAVPLLVPTSPAGAQEGLEPSPTPYTAVGLGYPTPPVDARAAALGGVGVGLLGETFTVRNPADLVGFSEASLGISAAPEAVAVRGAEGDASSGRSRFSVIRAVVPLGRWRASFGFGSELDQDWSFRKTDTLRISTGDFPFEERRENDGGVSTIDVSVARRVGPLSVGVSYQRLTGELRQDLFRRFAISVDSAVAAPNRVDQQLTWSYGAHRVRAGGGLEIGDRVRVSGAYSWTGDLEAEADSVGRRRAFAMPSSATAGASGRLSDDWLVTVGGGWSGWSSMSSSFRDGRPRDTYWGGGGLEFSGWELGALPLHLRAGGRYAELPFVRQGSEPAEEQAVTLGLGSTFARGQAALDLSIEVGSRGDLPATGMEESFTRFTFSASIQQ